MEELELSDYIAILRHRRKIFLSIATVLGVLSFYIALSWSTYRASAVVQIERPEISATATSQAGTSADQIAEAMADRSISEISEKITSTASLIEIISKFNLYPEARKSKPVADVAADMRKKIKIELINSAVANSSPLSKANQSAIAFTINFSYNNALLTQQVTDEIVSRFLDQDLKDRKAEAQSTSEFLAAQIAEMEKSLSEQEQKISEYQKQTGATRPENLAFNQQAAATLNLNIQSVTNQLASLDGTIGTIRTQLAIVDPYSRVTADGQVMTTPSLQLKALQSQYASLTSRYGAEHPDVVKTKRQIEALQPHISVNTKTSARLKARIADLKTNLEAAKNTHGAEHPDVVALQEQLRKAEESLLLQKNTGTPISNGVIEDADNPAYLQLVAQLRASEAQRASLDKNLKHLKEQQNLYQQAVITAPEAEKEMAALSRDYENAKIRYREMKAKQQSADMEVQMHKERKGRRLTLINPPELPTGTHPRRLMILLAGLFASAACGLMAAFGLHILGNKVVGVHHLETLVGAAPLVAIPHTQTKEEKKLSVSHRLKTLYEIVALQLKNKIKAYSEGSNGQA